MSQRWLQFLEKFGARGRTRNLHDFTHDLDVEGLSSRDLSDYDVLFRLFGPHHQSPWLPYHCPTLFASIGALRIVPKIVELSPGYREPSPPGAWRWLTPETMVIIDLPNGTALEVAVTLMQVGAQPVCTFDHWAYSSVQRNAIPAVDSAHLIDVMFTLARDICQIYPHINPDLPPVWICDSRRLGAGRSPAPGTFDNRYFIDDSILPGVRTLKRAGITSVVHFGLRTNLTPQPDLVPFLREVKKEGLSLFNVALQDQATWTEPEPMEAPFKQTVPIHSFRRTDRGGFGNLVPMPTEGSYSSSGGMGGGG